MMRSTKPFAFYAVVFLIHVPWRTNSQPLPEVKNLPRLKVLPELCLSVTEQDIYERINVYRMEKGLKPIPLSKSLTYVAQTHVRDLGENDPFHPHRCNLHSWSSKGPWSSCCYTEDQGTASCMWTKPGELTNYHHTGYEIAFWTDEQLSPLDFAGEALKGWKKSAGHNQVIINQGEWNDLDWNAMGVGYYKGYAVVWFGVIPDEDGEISLCEP
jgi:hypothetical protein